MQGLGVKVWLIVEFGLEEKAAKKLLEEVKNTFGRFELMDHSANKLKVRVPRDSNGGRIGFSRLFEFVERMKMNGLAKDYSVSETTLDHIFKYFAGQDVTQLQYS